MAPKKTHGVPAPAVHDPGDLPRVLSFALSARERAEVLRVLRRHGKDRAAALLAALGIEPQRGGGGRGG